MKIDQQTINMDSFKTNQPETSNAISINMENIQDTKLATKLVVFGNLGTLQRESIQPDFMNRCLAGLTKFGAIGGGLIGLSHFFNIQSSIAKVGEGMQTGFATITKLLMDLNQENVEGRANGNSISEKTGDMADITQIASYALFGVAIVSYLTQNIYNAYQNRNVKRSNPAGIVLEDAVLEFANIIGICIKNSRENGGEISETFINKIKEIEDTILTKKPSEIDAKALLTNCKILKESLRKAYPKINFDEKIVTKEQIKELIGEKTIRI